MAKKVKKKPRSGQKDKRGGTPLQKDHADQSIPAKTETVGDVGKERKICSHFDKDIDLAKVTSRISSAEHIKCEDCGLSVTEKKGKKVKGNQGKKKGGSSVDSKSSSKAIWICLECGRFFCGGIGFPTIPQSHAVRHAKQTHHQLAIQYENLRLRWCFPCNTLIPVEKSGESGESVDPFSDIVKVIKERPTEKASVDAEDIWFGSGSILSEIKSENTTSQFDVTSGYFVRGLVNLGNTCFFNSIMQNLLAMERLQNHYLELNESIGPLTVSLKKIFIETVSGSGLKNVINPRSFFGCVCAKAPQFKGFQQHDSHELLRCLLDGLCNEELSAKKRISRESGTSANKELTFVDASFSGELCSTVSCLDCGHSSEVFEPFLDLSLPVPTKRPPSKKANQSISRAKKQKAPPKRNGRYRPKGNKDAAPFPSKYTIPDAKPPGDSVDGSVGESVVVETKNTGSPSLTPVEDVEKRAFLENATDDSSWLDYLGTDFVSNDDHTASNCNDVEAFYDAGEKGDCQMDESVKDGIDSSSQVVEGTVTTTDLSEKISWLDFVEVGDVAHDNNKVSKVEDDSVRDNISGEVNSSGLVSQNIYEDSNCSLGNSCENEQSLQVQGSEVILLPYKEEKCSKDETLTSGGEVSSSSAITCEQDSLNFDGFGDLFNEPEVVEGPRVKPTSNTSESDPDEVDNSNSQVSVESCLAYFTKAELLSVSEHGWYCENCSRALKDQKKQSRKKHQKTADIIKQNEVPSEDNDAYSAANDDSSIAVCTADEVQQNEGQISGEEGSESEGNSGDEVSKSESVKVKRDATKKIIIKKAPSILTIHLKRFSQDACGRLSKLNGHVNFKDNFDLRPYMDPRCKDMDEYKYRLSGVVEHSGTMRGGHYIAYVRGSNNMWYYASDAHVNQVSLQQVLNCEAYILFYEKI